MTVRDAIGDLPEPTLDQSPPGISNHQLRLGAKSYPGHTGSLIDEPAKTLKAGDHGVPGGENMVRYHDGSVRYFTIKESARLQTFPDDYLIHGSWTESMRQLGNAVPVTLAEIVARSIYQSLHRHLAPAEDETNMSNVMVADRDTPHQPTSCTTLINLILSRPTKKAT